MLVKEKPELKNVEPFKTVLSGDFKAIAKLPLPDLEKIAVATLHVVLIGPLFSINVGPPLPKKS